MKLVTVSHEGREKLGLAQQEEIISLESLGLTFADMNELIEMISDDQLEQLHRAAAAGQGEVLHGGKLCAPIPRPKQDVLCLGINYLEHARESARYANEKMEERKQAVYFSKRVNEATPHEGGIDAHEDMLQDLDYECELAAVIRSDCYKLDRNEVRSHIFGYTILNDVSARVIQHAHKQWYFGKSLDSFCCMGPALVTADELTWPLEIDLETRVNGQRRQQANTRMMIFSLEDVIVELSQGMTLKSGTVIATGTPSGVAMGMEHPKYLKIGDVVECRIEGLGMLRNTVVPTKKKA